MIRMKIPGVKIYRSKGKTFRYHRATGIRLLALPGTPEFLSEFAAAEAKRLGKVTVSAGTFGALCAAYRASAHFNSLAPRTQSDYRKVLDWLAGVADMPIDQFTRPFVKQLKNKARQDKKRRFANYLISVLSAMFAWGEEEEIVSENPAARVSKVKRAKDEADANRPWGDDEWKAVIKEAPTHLRAPIMTMGILGWRGGECFAAKRDQWNRKANTLFRKASKSNKEVLTPVPGLLLKALQDTLPNDTLYLFLNSRGTKWTGNGFRASWRKLKVRLQNEGKIGLALTLHGLRHTCATRLAEMGFDSDTIADMLGQKTIAMAQHYSRRANTEKKLRGVVRKLDIRGKKLNAFESG